MEAYLDDNAAKWGTIGSDIEENLGLGHFFRIGGCFLVSRGTRLDRIRLGSVQWTALDRRRR